MILTFLSCSITSNNTLISNTLSEFKHIYPIALLKKNIKQKEKCKEDGNKTCRRVEKHSH